MTLNSTDRVINLMKIGHLARDFGSIDVLLVGMVVHKIGYFRVTCYLIRVVIVRGLQTVCSKLYGA